MGRTSLPREDALDLIAESNAAACGMDRQDRIVYWNAAATSTLGWSADEVLGRRCFDVLAGRDVFGNRYCIHNCPLTWAARHQDSLEPMFMEVRRKDLVSTRLSVRTIALPAPGPAFVCLVHVFETDENQDLTRLVDAIHHASRPGAATLPIDPPLSASPLSRREREIVFLLSNGYASLNIAMRLNLAHTTVRNHIQNILHKLDVHSQVEAVALSFRRGWM